MSDLIKGVPKLIMGLGTSFKSDLGTAVERIIKAWDAGFRGFDTAMLYKTESVLGDALKILMGEKGVAREEIFVITKILPWTTNPEEAKTLFNESLKKLQLHYVDMLMLHAPGPFLEYEFQKKMVTEDEYKAFPKTPEAFKEARCAMWQAVQELKAQGKVKRIGVSNYMRFHLEQLLKDPRCTEKPEINQVEAHPFYFDEDVYKACQENDIIMQAYSPLGNGHSPSIKKYSPNIKEFDIVLEEPLLHEIAAAHNCTAAQVCISWLNHRGVAMVTTSSKPDRMKENLNGLKIQLTEEDMEKINKLAERKKQRFFIDNYTVM